MTDHHGEEIGGHAIPSLSVILSMTKDAKNLSRKGALTSPCKTISRTMDISSITGLITAGARYYTIFRKFHQLDDKKGLPFRFEP